VRKHVVEGARRCCITAKPMKSTGATLTAAKHHAARKRIEPSNRRHRGCDAAPPPPRLSARSPSPAPLRSAVEERGRPII
jgi:hypothetical protein